MTDVSIEFAIFCKAPVVGRVKTRLIPAFGAERAATIYRELLERTVRVAHATSSVLGAKVSLWVADDIDHPAIVELALRYGIERFPQQPDADLGARMFDCLQKLQRDNIRVVLIGSDCPVFSVNHLVNAANAMSREVPWVFTPASDGGYVLVGTCHATDHPFRNMQWSHSNVMAETRKRLSDAKISWTETAALWDIDGTADVIRAESEGLITTMN
jgi:uncharacterized protein